ncbi:efflux RND transporter periplasmic adaptor subunit [Kordia sp. YSTF-M3]|uniref:Efflux RND transporter periplasmic adaptor subunit n=1 Tax=Kordia aestuariivivens TaxID=2759037 RepID=A0ABR7QEY6_9FLAO|nr:efflux RND transporter periplasmic adaptor subunit [Kordia aestuariivivens]MBC8757104.1 efflux RND transporter periplasmic adaptor subunit [Kordia aestuariivivens]
MKKYIIYIVLIVVGIVIGKFVFSGETAETHTHETTAEASKWTCSMHPQIMLTEAGDCPICGMDLIPMEESSTKLSSDQFRMSKNAMALANIETTKISEGTAADTAMKLTGTIEANEKTNAIQTAHFGGRIEKLYVNITGEEVRKGQRIALIYSPELVTTQQELITAIRMKESQPALYKAVRNKLKLWKLSEAQIQQIETSQKVSSQFPIYASVSGVVTEKMVSEGNHIMEGGALFKVSNLNTVWASFDAYEKQLSSLKKGDEITITTNANPNEKISAKITFIDPVLNTATRTVSVKVELNNRDGKLKPGMFVTGLLATNTAKSTVLTIPKSAILWTGKRSIVYVKTSANEPVFEAREITLGTAIADNYEVVSGLTAEDEIVTNGTFTVDAAAQLQGKKSMMNARKETSTKKEPTKLEFDAAFEKSFQASIKAYVELKDALVQSDVKLAAAKSEAFRKALELLTIPQRDASNMYWSMLHKTSKGINKDVTIEKQREKFRIISNHIIEMVQNFDTLDQQLTVQFCPMANNDKGAYWLSTEEKIRNPYFGDMMLTCGEVKQVLK